MIPLSKKVSLAVSEAVSEARDSGESSALKPPYSWRTRFSDHTCGGGSQAVEPYSWGSWFAQSWPSTSPCLVWGEYRVGSPSPPPLKYMKYLFLCFFKNDSILPKNHFIFTGVISYYTVMYLKMWCICREREKNKKLIFFLCLVILSDDCNRSICRERESSKLMVNRVR